MSGTNASITSSSDVTSPASIRTKTAILISGLSVFLTADIKVLLTVSTAVVASPMPSAFTAEFVTARVGQSPSICTRVVLLVQRPFLAMVRYFPIISVLRMASGTY